MIPRIFEHQSVAIVAGGPSLAGFDFGELSEINTIAINRAHEFLPRATVLWWSDAKYWRKSRDSILAHSSPHKATCQIGYLAGDDLPPEIEVYQFTGLQGFDPDPAHLRHGNNSAYAATHLAAHLGAAQIVLFGVDMRHAPDGRTHFHGGHGVLQQGNSFEIYMVPFFKSLAGPLAERGIQVLNASPDSALTVWPRCSIEEGVKACAQFSPTTRERRHGNAMGSR